MATKEQIDSAARDYAKPDSLRTIREDILYRAFKAGCEYEAAHPTEKVDPSAPTQAKSAIPAEEWMQVAARKIADDAGDRFPQAIGSSEQHRLAAIYIIQGCAPKGGIQDWLTKDLRKQIAWYDSELGKARAEAQVKDLAHKSLKESYDRVYDRVNKLREIISAIRTQVDSAP